MLIKATAVLVGFLSFVLAGCGFGFYKISTESMRPTFNVGDRFLTEPVETHGDAIKRFDVVVYKPQPLKGKNPSDLSGQIIVGRVVGLPGDKFETRGVVVYINGEALEEPFEKLPSMNADGTDRFDIKPFVVPGNEYVILGDNRENSLDARHWTKPSIERTEIIGRVTIVR